jgi:hypothetical protein
MRRATSWSDAFRSYLLASGVNRRQAAIALKVPPSSVTQWCQGAVPREETRRRIAKWSKGAVPVWGVFLAVDSVRA